MNNERVAKGRGVNSSYVLVLRLSTWSIAKHKTDTLWFLMKACKAWNIETMAPNLISKYRGIFSSVSKYPTIFYDRFLMKIKNEVENWLFLHILP